MTKKIVSLAIFLIASFQIQAQDQKMSESIMDAMHQPMMEVPFQKTDNPDLDYLVNMVPHHQGAIDSAEQILKVSKSASVKKLANNIIAAQKKEIAMFNKIIATLPKTSDYDSTKIKTYISDSEKAMMMMMKAMMAVKLTGNNDKDFLEGMIIHHQGAVDASNILLKICTNDQTKNIANTIIRDQKKEISEMQKMLKSL